MIRASKILGASGNLPKSPSSRTGGAAVGSTHEISAAEPQPARFRSGIASLRADGNARVEPISITPSHPVSAPEGSSTVTTNVLVSFHWPR
eukprot:7205945-Prymnesium_polylepis.2